MTQDQIDRLVARATGESLTEIRHRGFGIADPVSVSFDPEPSGISRTGAGSISNPDARGPLDDDREPLVVDWDELEASRHVLYPVY